MERLVNFLTSRQLMGSLFIMLASVLAVATFLENDFGYDAARAMVYNTWWFELIFLLLSVNMFGNLFAFNMWRWRKAPVLLFHLAFFIILAGAAVTRYIGYEGSMSIREGEASNTIYTTDSYVTLEISDNRETQVMHEKVFLSPKTPYEFSKRLKIGGNRYQIKSVGYTENGVLRPVKKSGGKPLLVLLLSSGTDRREQFFLPGKNIYLDGLNMVFEPKPNSHTDVIFRQIGNKTITITSTKTITRFSMGSQYQETIEPGTTKELTTGSLYSIGNVKFAMSQFFPEAELAAVSMPMQGRASMPDLVAFEISNDQVSYDLFVSGKSGDAGHSEELNLPEGNISIRYGSLPVELPFTLKLNDFQLERYPGSESPSSYASEVTVIDPAKNKKMNYRIFMNNILNYGGYRFYQSSYDRDEKGTILSVNHDFPGTLITYIGYFLMSISMFWSLFASHTRFRQLLRKTDKFYKQRKSITTIFLILLLSLPSFSQDMPPKEDPEIAAKLGQLWVQDKGGRIKPLNSMHQEVMIKLVKHNSFKGLNPDQMLLGILTHPSVWQQVPLITVKHPELRKIIGIKARKASFNDFFDQKKHYKIGKQVDIAYRKNPAKRDKFEQELIKVDEQVNVFYLAQSGELHHLFPVSNSPDKPWLAPSEDPEGLSEQDSLFVTSAFPSFIAAMRDGSYKKATKILNDIGAYQKIHGGNLLPPESKLKAEILYNRLNIFMWLASFFFVLGIILVLYNIAGLVYPPLLRDWILKVSSWLIITGFAYHTFGIGLRWYISEHAPWSNGYESMIFIGWALLLAGLLFRRRSPLVLSVTALFSGIVLLVSHLSWMNPEITNLVPVLKSYWLTLHVAIIIGGYGFLTLGALLGFLNLLLTGLQNQENRIRVSLTIDELTAINEMTLIVGLYLMTIGSFLGGIWANESWGRYWGWDPKETWSLITVLIYAFVVHMRMIPGLRGRMAFNTASLLSFASVVMTYLGVNYYLTGMHSYAAGDPVPVPAAVYYILVIVAVLIGYAYWKEGKIKAS